MLEARRVRDLPKVQLHCHLEGTVGANTFLQLARSHNVDLGPRAGLDAEAIYRFESFGEFLLTFADVCKALRAPHDYARIAHEYVVDAITQQVRYAELFISPSVWTYFHGELDVRAAVAAIKGVFDAARDAIDVVLICDVTRNFGPQRALATARLAVELRDLGVIGIGLGGDEANYPARDYSDAFRYARDRGLRCVAHAGEAAGPDSVREAIDILGAERIGHGVRAIEAPLLVAELARRRIALEICPTSNHLTGVVARDVPHPLGELDASGVLCTIDADDPALFSTSITGEYRYVEAQFGAETVNRLARNAIDASFANAARKADLLAELDAYLAQATLDSITSPEIETARRNKR